MTAKINPYEILGVERSASAAEIKSAYRKKVKVHHPDAGGKRKDFERVNRANIVLMNPAKREKFDRTGEVDDDQPDNAISAPLGIILGLIQAMCQQAAQGQGGDPMTVNIVEIMTREISKTISNLENQKRQIAKLTEKFRKISERLKTKDGDGIINKALLSQAGGFTMQLGVVDQQIKAHQDAKVMLMDYSFTSDEAPKAFGLGTTHYFRV